MITDPRVAHFWDDQKVLGRWFAALDNPDETDPGIVWDAYYLYGPEAQWDAMPAPLIVRGATVVDEYQDLEQSLLRVLK